jgi:glutamyl-tRNA reductase
MALLTLGVSYRSASLDLLERLSYDQDSLIKAYRMLHDDEAIRGAVILSTCNRVEILADVESYHAGFLAVRRVLSQTRDVEPDLLGEPLYAHWEHEAAGHLFEVASGLDSMILGETQILGQVRDSIRRAEEEGTTTPELRSTFQAASRAGRRVRNETELGAAPDAFVSAGASAAEAAIGSLTGRSAVVVGAGQMAALAAKRLRGSGVGSLRVVNRSIDHARALSARVQATAFGLDRMREALDGADLVMSATGAAGTLIDEAMVREATAANARPLVIVDIAVPHDVEPAVAEIAGVTLIGLDDVRKRVASAYSDAEGEVEKARDIVAEEVQRWRTRRRAEEIAPVIRTLRERGESVVRAELRRSSSRLRDLTPDERDAVEALARGIVAKLIHEPIVSLKGTPDLDGARARLLSELFGIE